jgi:hypothetical protein
MTVYLIYKDDAWHTKGSGELLRVADNLQKCYATAEANGASEEQSFPSCVFLFGDSPGIRLCYFY